MKFDISYLLESWDYHPGQLAVRKFTGTDGVEKLQMRLDLGILQMNTDGRPDGKLPMGFASWFEFHEDRLEKHKQENEGSEDGFELAGPDITRLQQEAIQFHHRYICFYQLGEYDKVARDAERNLKVFDFVDDYAASDELSWSLQQFRPQLIMMLTRAEGSLAIEAGDLVQAVEVIREGIDALKEFYLDFERQDLLDNSGEIHSLEQWLEEIETNPLDGEGESDSDKLQPLTKLERLERDLNKAVELEDYEKAAKIRDQINNLKAS
ncbi:MAG: UvrB/UvrC motif-containing protein [Verrucomicrobiae bacterium]|jgi:tetratricopeptide (TPR) repeat protein|nr:UvrB/UvrC motif-containing protein [Verrucomicrobiae bacterium]